MNHTKLVFKGAQKFEDLTKSQNFCGTLFHKISFIVLAKKKIGGVRCTLTKKKNLLKIITLNERVEEAGAATRPDILRLFGQGNFIFHQEKRSGNFEK